MSSCKRQKETEVDHTNAWLMKQYLYLKRASWYQQQNEQRSISEVPLALKLQRPKKWHPEGHC